MTCSACQGLLLFSNNGIITNNSSEFVLGSVNFSKATSTTPSVPFVISVRCTSENCTVLSSLGTIWHVCLACSGYKCETMRIFRRHEATEKHFRNLRTYNIAYSAGLEHTSEEPASVVEIMQQEEEDEKIHDSMSTQDQSDNFSQFDDDQIFDDDNELFSNNPSINDGTIGLGSEDWLLSIAGPRQDGEISLEELQAIFPTASKAPQYYNFVSLHPNKGANFLTAKAFEQNPVDVSDREALFALKVAQLVSGLSGREQQLFADILFDVCNAHNAELTIFERTRPPTSLTDIQDMFVKGKNAILQNLPQPVVYQSQNHESHAYVNIVDVLANMMAQATIMERFDEQTTSSTASVFGDHDVTVSSTPAGLELYLELKEDVLASDGSFIFYIWIREWSDDFDPSHTKSNRCQVWLKTCTFCPPASSKDDRNTAFIAIGSKGDDHEEIEKLLNSQLRELGHMNGKKMYHGGLNRMIQVKAGIITTCVDRPERTKLFQIGDHNGKFSVCWSFAANVDGSGKDNCLPSCPFCRHKLISRYFVCEEQLPDSSSYTTEVDDLSTTSQIAPDEINLLLNNSNNEEEDTSNGANSGDSDESDSSSEHNDESDNIKCAKSYAGPQRAGRGGGTAAVAPAAGECPFGKCSSWNLLDGSFSFPAPSKFPLLYDTSPGAPTPPPGREVLSHIPIKERKLISVNLTVEWLHHATLFAYHNYKTCPPGHRSNRRFWRKENLVDFLRTCGIVNKLQQEIAHCAHNNLPCPVPTMWTRKTDALRRCHYAPMHMLFLGHVKSNFLMVEKWLKRYELKTDFGKQANLVLKGVQRLRLRRFFNAQPLSTSSFGPGSWVSENYLFWERASKYFFTLPSIQSCRHSTAANNEVFLYERRVAQRFVAAGVACICRLMSDNRSSDGMSDIIKIYMDTMVEMDSILLKTSGAAVIDEQEEQQEDEAADVLGAGDTTNNDDGGVGAGKRAISKRQGQKEQTCRQHRTIPTQRNAPNYVKSNSLGLLAAVEAHEYFGPAILNWEGGFTGERKIQDVKPLLGIRRSNTEWESIVMKRLYQQETIDWIVSGYTNNDEKGSLKQDRVIEGLYSVYRNRNDAINAIGRNEPLSAIIVDNDVWLTYRPTSGAMMNWNAGHPPATRSSVSLLKICFGRCAVNRGEEICGCWMEPIAAGDENDDKVGFGSFAMLENVVEQHVLMLPLMRVLGQQRGVVYSENLYYCIGDKWTERDSSGNFSSYALHSDMFQEWKV